MKRRWISIQLHDFCLHASYNLWGWLKIHFGFEYLVSFLQQHRKLAKAENSHFPSDFGKAHRKGYSKEIWQ